MSSLLIRRWLWGATGFAWFFWLGIEDRSVVLVLGLALMVAASVILSLPLDEWGWVEAGVIGLPAAGLIGVVAGAAVPLLAVLLMFIKVSLHSHEQPDFSLEQVVLTLKTIPVWSAAGGLVGAAAGLIQPKGE